MLDYIWSKLKMPAAQKLEMGIKYGDHKFPQIDKAVTLWMKIADLVSKREVVLGKLEQFELSASNPKYLFLL